MSEYDLRQLSLMQDKIKQYREGQIRINQLIEDLEALLSCLERINEDWKDSFISAWMILEIEYASALHNGKSSLDDRAMVEINKSLKQLDLLINNLLAN